MGKLEEQAIEIAKGEILKKLAADEPYIYGENGVYHKVKAVQNGELHITLRIYEGFVTDVVYTQVKRHVFKKAQLTNPK